MAKTSKKQVLVPRWSFPSSTASNIEKDKLDFGLNVGKAIQSEWFYSSSGSTCSFYDKWARYQVLRSYARGEQSTARFRKLIAHNGDASFLNLDWSPLPVGEKFVDLVVNGMNERLMSVKATSKDITSSRLRDQYQTIIEKDMIAKDFLKKTQQLFGINAFNVESIDDLPTNTEELQLHMQIKYKPGIEIAEEQAISTVFDMNEYHNIKYRNAHDVVTLGEAWQKHRHIPGEGIKIEYVDPQHFIHSFTNDPHYNDVFYYGEPKIVPLTELKKINPSIDEQTVARAKSSSIMWNDFYRSAYAEYSNALFAENTCTVLFFSYKTTRTIDYTTKPTPTGARRSKLRSSDFNPSEEQMTQWGWKKTSIPIDVWYEGAMILGTDILLKWEVDQSMIRPESNFRKTIPSYVGVAPKLHGSTNGVPKSIVSRMISSIDQLQLTHLKLQQISKRMTPDGVYINVDGFTGINLGPGVTYTPETALDLYYATGSVIGRNLTEDGDYNHAQLPIKELTSSGSSNKISTLIAQYNTHMGILSDLIGTNKAVDGTNPDPRSLVGVQKMAALNSNTATRHILDALVFMTKRCAEGVSLRLADILKDPGAAEEFAAQIGVYNVSLLKSISSLPLHSFGIFIEVAPDVEERNDLKNKIDIALKEKSIELEDAIEIEQIGNIKLALEMLKHKKRKRDEYNVAREREKMEMQTASNIQSAREAAKASMEKVNAEAQAKMALENSKTQGQIAVLEKEVELKKELMAEEFEYKKQLVLLTEQGFSVRDSLKEDRKDKRVDIQSTNESKLIDQKKYGYRPVNFESREDTLDGIEMSNL